MNRELLNKIYTAAVDFCVKQGPNPDGTNKAWLWEEKFAELLLNECIEEVYPSDFKVDGIVPHNLADAVSRIKERFGLPE